MKAELFYISTRKGNAYTWEQVKGTRYSIEGFELFGRKVGNHYTLSDIISGCAVIDGMTKAEAVNNFEVWVKMYGGDHVNKIFEQSRLLVKKKTGENPAFN